MFEVGVVFGVLAFSLGLGTLIYVVADKAAKWLIASIMEENR